MGCGAAGPSPTSAVSMFWPFRALRDGGVHHQFGQAHGCLVEGVDGGASLVVVVLS